MWGHIRGRRYYRNRSGIVIPKCLVSVSESNFAHPWVSVSVLESNLSFFGYPTKKNGRFLQFLPYTSSKVLVSVSKSESNFAHPWVSKSVSKSSRPFFGINIVIDTENPGIAGSCKVGLERGRQSSMCAARGRGVCQ